MINFLPPEEKKILKTEEKWKLTLILEILVLFFFICLILILLSIKIYVSGKTESQNIAIQTVGKEFKSPETQGLKERILTTNKNIINLDNFYQGQVYLTDTLEKVSSNLPFGVYITNFSCQKQILEKDHILRITLSGFAPNMDALFEFGKNLEKNFSTKVAIKEESWIKPSESEFQLSFEIKVNK